MTLYMQPLRCRQHNRKLINYFSFKLNRNVSHNLHKEINMNCKINNIDYSVTSKIYSLDENNKPKSEFFYRYFGQSPEWTMTCTPINIDHPFLEITEDDISCALNIIQDIHVEDINLIIVDFLLQFFLADTPRKVLRNMVSQNTTSFDPVQLYLYDKCLLISSLNSSHVHELYLYPDRNFIDVLEHVNSEELLNIYDYYAELRYDGFTVKQYMEKLYGRSDMQFCIPIPFLPLSTINPSYETKEKPSAVIKIEPYRNFTLALRTQTKYESGEYLFFDKHHSLQRLNKFSYSVLSNITWDNVAIAGGCLSLILSTKLKWEDFPASDIDLFVWGASPVDILMTINRLLDELRKNHDICVFQRGNVLTVIVRHIPRNIQIMNSGFSSLNSVLNDFDFTSSRIAFDGKDFVATSEYMISAIQQCTWSQYDSIGHSRMVKNYQRGITVLFKDTTLISGDKSYMPKDLDDIENEPSTIAVNNKYLHVTTEPVQRILYLVRLLFSPHYNLVTGYVTDISENWRKDYECKNIDTYTPKLFDFQVEIRNTNYNRYSYYEPEFYSLKFAHFSLINDSQKPLYIKLNNVQIFNFFCADEGFSIGCKLFDDHLKVLTDIASKLAASPLYRDERLKMDLPSPAILHNHRNDVGELITPDKLLIFASNKKYKISRIFRHHEKTNMTCDMIRSYIDNNRVLVRICIKPYIFIRKAGNIYQFDPFMRLSYKLLFCDIIHLARKN